MKELEADQLKRLEAKATQGLELSRALLRIGELEAALLGIQQRLPRSSGWDDLQVREYCEDVCRAALAKGKT